MVCKYVLPSHRLTVLLLIVSFAAQTFFFSLMRSHLFIFAYVAFAFGVRAKKIIAKTHVKEIFPRVFFSEFYRFSS